MTTFKSGGIKLDANEKPKLYMATRHMLVGISEGLMCGVRKGYPVDNWKKGLPIASVSLNAALSHIFKYLDGEDMNVEIDVDGNEFETHHLDNALTNLAMAVHQIKSLRTDLDDRTSPYVSE